VNAILYVNRIGIAWEYLPHDFPPCKTVYDYYAKREADGTTQVIHDLLRRKVREQAGRAAEPTAAIIDARVVKTSSNAPEGTQGYDAGKRVKGVSSTSRPTRWPLLLIGALAAVAIWSRWVGLGGLCGIGVIHPLPGIWDSLRINTAITLPVGVEA